MIEAIKGISFEVNQGEIVTLIGANGAGKSTTLNTVSGLLKSATGSVTFMGEDLGKVPPHKIVSKGLALVPEGRRVFPRMSVFENLQMGASLHGERYFQEDLEKVCTLFPRLAERKTNLGTQLSGGEQQMLAVGRALVLNPRLLLLDEPLEGLAPIIVEELLKAIRRVTREEGLSAIIVEQHPQAILAISDRAAVLDRGSVVHSGGAAELRAQPALLDQLLGVVR
jgi:branched-chain amino acid transport system ATP-binding protein